MFPSHRAALLLLLAVPLGCADDGGPDAADAEAATTLLREADRRYTQVMDAGDVEGIVSLYAPDATRYPPDGEPVSGLDAMRAFAEGVASLPGFTLRAEPIALEVAAAGDLGYTLNLLELTVDGPDGRPTTSWLRDFHVWRRGADGAWRIVEDLWHVMALPPEAADGR